ncbi:hypothetical protein M9434_001501 [Picochlorum sp. BPE23]|nr:hypothetical protein M9434_001501 [Picochlorum sp. BPE23]
MNGFLAEDVKEIASANRLPRLDHVHELVSESESVTLKSKKKQVQVLRQCLLLQLECCVTEAQRARSIPQPTELAQLPVFQEARAIDSTYVLQEKESHARREEEEARLRMEQERLEAERRVERQKEKEAQRQKRLESKELRRQERMAAKKESRLALREEKRQRYEQEVDAWQEALREKQDSLDALHGRIKRADVQRKEMAESLSIIEKEKEALLERLRHVATTSEKQDEESDKPMAKSSQRDGPRRDDSYYKGPKSPQRSGALEGEYVKSLDSRSRNDLGPRDDRDYFSDRLGRSGSSISIRRRYDDRGPRGRGAYRHSIRHGPPMSPRPRYDDRRPGPVRTRYDPPSTSSKRSFGDPDKRFDRHASYK